MEAAALLFHAYMGGESGRLANIAYKLSQLRGEEAEREVFRQLSWLTFVAIKTGQSISKDAMTNLMLRAMQFRMASKSDSDCLPDICSRWAEDIEKVHIPEAVAINKFLMWNCIGFAWSSKIPVKHRLDAIKGLSSSPKTIEGQHVDLGAKFFEIAKEEGLPEEGTIVQALFLCAIRSIEDLDSLSELQTWLEEIATDDIRKEFDEMLGWPMIQTLGGFVTGAWAATHEHIQDWKPWLKLFDRVDAYAKRYSSPRFGREAAKSKAIILTEYLDRSKDALLTLDQAQDAFGLSAVLLEQRANTLFQSQDDESVLLIWSQLTTDPATKKVLDPFAYRRAGISAARLKQYNKAAKTFKTASDKIEPGSLEITHFGLCVDEAFAYALDGNRFIAAEVLVKAALSLPVKASNEGEERWDAVLRSSITICSTIADGLWRPKEVKPTLEIGYVSSPNLKSSKLKPGQPARKNITTATIIHLASTLGIKSSEITKEVYKLIESDHYYIRWLSAEALLSVNYSNGAGEGFIKSLLGFDRVMTDLASRTPEELFTLNSDEGVKTPLQTDPKSWFGLVCAGLICAGTDLDSNLRIWLEDSIHLLGKEASLTQNIVLIIEGVSLSSNMQKTVANDYDSSSYKRIGAAAKRLLEDLSGKETLLMQTFLASGFVVDESIARQEIFNYHVASHFAKQWRKQSLRRFQFYSPRTSVPDLLEVIYQIERGNSTLRNVLIAASNALRRPLGQFMQNLL